jgi:hypothetical protein
MHGRDEKYVQNSVWGNSRVERDYLGDTGVQGKIILKWIIKLTGWRGCVLSSTGS